jgi:cellulose synthase/poly-beta-1,6-N-acetylglucosamine synthase-like glycosyltransferase
MTAAERAQLEAKRVVRRNVVTMERSNYLPEQPVFDVQTPKRRKDPKQMLALLIAAHNEELVLENTIRSAIRAGMPKAHIYVVDDNSSDTTSLIAKRLVGEDNVIKVRRSGKGTALSKAAKKFKLTKRYRWIHIADADGAFAPNYFNIFRGSLRGKYAAATGYVRSLAGSDMSQYRVFEYTIGMEFIRRFQALTHVITVIPGPTSCFRSDVFEQLNFANHSLTEDFDVTIQIHRKKLGKIQFIPKAIAYTQDPKTFHDFVRQITRWNRGIMQGILRHKIGRKFSRIDFYLMWQVFQNLLFFTNYVILVPLVAYRMHSISIIAFAFLFDILLTLLLTIFAAARSLRRDILSAFPVIYALRWVVLYIFMKSAFEVVILRKYRVSTGTWETAGRRYKIDTSIVKTA